MRRAVVIGASGFLGGRLLARLGPHGVGTFRARDIAGGVAFDATRERFRDLAPSLPADLTHVIVPFGAIDMEGCARDPAATSAVNVVAVIGVLKDALDQGLTPLFVSTDYVFDGAKSHYQETDPAHPRMAYGAQKLAVEHWLGTLDAPWTVVRLSKVVSGDTTTHSMLGQWVNELRRGQPMRCATDQFFSPAFVDDLADAIVQLCERSARGLFHAAGPERFSRMQLLQLLVSAIAARTDAITTPIAPCGLHELPFLEKRPLDTSLNVDRLRDAIDYRFTPMATLCAEIAAAEFPG